MPRQRLVGLTATLLVVALGGAAVALVVVPDHHTTSIRITQLAAAAAVVITALGSLAVVVAADAFAHRSDRAPAADERPASAGGELQDPVGLWVRLAGEGQRPFLVVSAERENATFLVARDDEQAQWISKDRIESWAVRPAE